MSNHHDYLNDQEAIERRLAEPCPDGAVRCSECGHFFDPSDRRGAFAYQTDKRYPPVCPCCWTEQHGGMPAWAVWNDCQGIFSDAVRDSRKEAEAMLSSSHADIGGRVVPVRVIVEQEERHWRRDWDEQAKEKAA